jgi:dTDP-4-amino-4,6-dideoxygalactose transaminase
MADQPRRVPLIKADLPPIEAVEPAFREILANGRVTNFGPFVTRFEHDASAYLGVEAVCLSSATAGLIMTLQALDVPAGSRVAIPSFSFVATAQAVRYAGCTPVFVEVRPDGNVDPDDLARVFRDVEDVRAAVLVHMYGLPVRTEEIETVVGAARARAGSPIRVVYDAAHAFGSSRDGVRVGSAGDAEVFSTSVTKVMTSVEGGIVASRNRDLMDRLRRMRNYGIHSHYDAHYPGLNGKMSEFHAIVGIANLARIDDLLRARTGRAAFYLKQVHAEARSRVIAAPAGTVSTYKDFTVMVPADLKSHRDAIIAALADQAIETRAYFHPPIHEQRYFRPFADRPLPVTEDLSRRVITLPFFSTISEAEMTHVARALGAAEAAVVGSRAVQGTES